MTPNELVQAARRAMKNAHAPYSDYKVGAALLCDDGQVYMGCNVENASFGLTICAERTAIFAAVADGRKEFTAMAIAASREPAPFPCGACRQVMAEFCGPDFPVHVARGDKLETTTLGKLLPHSFELGGSNG
jgi:cytidine deaminase